MDDGVIKYKIDWTDTDCITESEIKTINFYRQLLWQKKLIGEDENGIGYGNISFRDPKNAAHFIVSGTQTGKHEWLKNTQYAKVTYWNIKNNSIFCQGKTKASSEALTHANLYQKVTDCQVVIHIHNSFIWHSYYNIFPTTSKEIVYGSPEMAETVQFLISKNNSKLFSNILIMGGHQDGVLAYGNDFDSVTQQLIQLATSS